MNIHKKLAVTTSGVAFLLTTAGSAPAAAAIFNFSYSGASVRDSKDTVTASGVLTTSPYDPATNSYQITSITGTRNGDPIDSLLPPNSLLDNDNVLLAGSTQLDENGFAYIAGGQSYNVFHSYANVEIATDFTGYPLSSFSVTPVSVPEPDSISGLLGMSVLTGVTLLKQKLKQKYVATTADLRSQTGGR